MNQGLHYDMPTADYYADRCPQPSLTQSIAKLLLAKSPAHARLAHPKLNPGMVMSDETKYDIGHIAHRLVLGRGRELCVIDHDDWRTKAAREIREEAAAMGKLAVLAKDFALGEKIKDRAFAQLADRGHLTDWARPNRPAEVVAIAQAGPIWLRTMIDWLPTLTSVWDYKTTAKSAHPEECWRFLVDAGWPIQAAMHERILNLINPDNAGRRVHRFIVQENYEPYALSVVRLTETHLSIGRAQLARAEDIWTQCMAANHWPAYSFLDQTPEYPGWALTRELTE